MNVRRSYAWRPRPDGACEIYAADFRTLAKLGRHVRRLAKLGITNTHRAAGELRTAATEAAARAVRCRTALGIAPEPLHVVIAATGWIQTSGVVIEPWRALRARFLGRSSSNGR